MGEENQIEKKPKEKSNFVYAFAGAGSGIATRALCQPLDVIKIRFQLQMEPIAKSSVESKYRGTLQATSLIIKEEGFVGLWRGHVSAQLLSAIYGFVQFQTYEVLKMKAEETVKGAERKKYVHFVSGSIAGCTATIFSFPFDVIRTRLVAQGNNRVYNGVVHGLTDIYMKEGLRGYVRGLSPTLIVAGPLAGCNFLFYSTFKNTALSFDFFKDLSKEGKITPTAELICGSLAGVASKVVTYPCDLARKRMQLQEFHHARIGFGKNFWCQGLANCFVQTLREEKVPGLFKGLYPSLVKAAFTTALHFAVYEEILNRIR